jgi:DNA gyrase/topoisomerase IV subunit A
VKEFVQWRLGFYTVRYQKLITDLSSELAYYQALKTCYDKKLPSFLPTAANRAEVKNRVVDLTKNHKITDEQVERIVSLASYRWAKDFYQQVIDRIAALVKDIDNYQAILRDPKKIRKIYRQEVEQLRKIPAVTR